MIKMCDLITIEGGDLNQLISDAKSVIESYAKIDMTVHSVQHSMMLLYDKQIIHYYTIVFKAVED